MKTNNLLKWVNLITALLLVVAFAAIALLKSGVINVMDRGTIREIHEIAGVLFSVFALLHLLLNWKWIKSTYFKKKK